MATFLTNAWTDFEKFFGVNGQTTADLSSYKPGSPGAKMATSAATLQNMGMLTAVFGGINSAIGSFYAAKTQQYQLQSEASALQFQSGMDAINAHQAEMSAQSIEEAGKTQVQQYTMRAGQENASAEVSTAARGVDLSSGSAVTERASRDLVKQMDVLTINANATRAAWSKRTQATNDNNASLLSSVSAQNMRTSASSISPVSATTTSLLSSATSIASQWDWRRRLQLSTASSFMPSGVGQ